MVANEDACVAIDDGERTLVAVCDGHHGHQASHGLAEGLGLVEGCRATERTQHDVLMLNLPKKNRPASGGRRASRSDRGG